MATIRDLLTAEKPREKLATIGVSALSDAELLALLLTTSGVRGVSVVDLARSILKKGGSLRKTARLTPEDLSEIRGIGPAKAAIVAAAFELSRRIESEEPLENPVFTTPEQLARFLLPKMRDELKEQLVVLLFDSSQRLLEMVQLAAGGFSSVFTDPREIFEIALRKRAHSIILAHNHPSGDPSPSDDDIRLTKRIAEAGRLIGIPLLDHLVLGNGGFISMAALKFFDESFFTFQK